MRKKLLGWLKEIILSIVILTIVLNVISFIKKPELASNTLPQFKLTTTKQKLLDAKEYQGKPLLIHFWATWCPTCKLEASTIQTLSKSYQVLTIAINSGTDDEINLFMDGKGLDYDVVNDADGSFASRFDVSSFPTTFIYDKNAKIKFAEVGYTSTLGLKLRMWLAN